MDKKLRDQRIQDEMDLMGNHAQVLREHRPYAETVQAIQKLADEFEEKWGYLPLWWH